jgi:hypothetical protein
MERKMKKILIIAILCALGCSGQNNITNPTKHVEVKDDISLCADSCTNIRKLDCEESKDLVYPGSSCSLNAKCKDGICKNNKCTETCEMVCEALAKEGRYLGLECWQTITKCSEIETVCR